MMMTATAKHAIEIRLEARQVREQTPGLFLQHSVVSALPKAARVELACSEPELIDESLDARQFEIRRLRRELNSNEPAMPVAFFGRRHYRVHILLDLSTLTSREFAPLIPLVRERRHAQGKVEISAARRLAEELDAIVAADALK